MDKEKLTDHGFHPPRPQVIAPDLDGFARVWCDDFEGRLGFGVDPTLWNQIDSAHNANNEVEVYTSGTENVSVDGLGSYLFLTFLFLL